MHDEHNLFIFLCRLLMGGGLGLGQQIAYAYQMHKMGILVYALCNTAPSNAVIDFSKGADIYDQILLYTQGFNPR